MVDAALFGDFKTANALQQKLLPLTDLLFSDTNPMPVKNALMHLGYDCGPCRLPLSDVKEELSEKIKVAIQ